MKRIFKIEKIGIVKKTKTINGFPTVFDYNRWEVTLFGFISFYVDSIYSYDKT